MEKDTQRAVPLPAAEDLPVARGLELEPVKLLPPQLGVRVLLFSDSVATKTFLEKELPRFYDGNRDARFYDGNGQERTPSISLAVVHQNPFHADPGIQGHRWDAAMLYDLWLEVALMGSVCQTFAGWYSGFNRLSLAANIFPEIRTTSLPFPGSGKRQPKHCANPSGFRWK
eukprot:g19570.t1